MNPNPSSETLEDIHRKIDYLIEDRKKVMSWEVVVLLVVIAVIGALWGYMIRKIVRVKDPANGFTRLLITVVSIAIMAVLAWRIDYVPKFN